MTDRRTVHPVRLWPLLARLTLFVWAGLFLGTAQAAPSRIALIIGNGAYESMPLKNPVHDAQDLAKALKDVGFDVILKQNLGAVEMKRAISDFGDRLAQNKGVGLFYFSGHGVQTHKGKNYLMPVGYPFKRERDVELFAVEARAVLASMEEAGNPLNIVVLDACRDSPLPAESRSTGSKIGRASCRERVS
jgi:uncharacterized caspase-like protein